MTNTTYTPFVYLIVWKNGMMYVGSRTRNSGGVQANPKEFWKKYFTSSKVVKQYRKEFGEPIQFIVFPFEDGKEAVEAETQMLIKLNAKSAGCFLNMHNGDGKFSYAGNSPTYETRKKLSEGKKGKTLSEEHKKNISEAKKGQTPWNKGKVGKTPWNKGKVGIYSEETLSKMSETHKGKPKPERKGKITCFDILQQCFVYISTEEYHSNPERYFNIFSKTAKDFQQKQKLWNAWYTEYKTA